MPASGPIKLRNDITLVGQDDWADGRYGNNQASSVRLNDSRLIGDLFKAKLLGSQQLLIKMQELADKDAQKLLADLKYALQTNPTKIIVLTHVPLL